MHGQQHSSLAALQWYHNERDGNSNQQCLDCLLSHLFRRRSKKTLKFCVADLFWGESTSDQWIPLIKGQLRGKYFHLMTSSCDKWMSLRNSPNFLDRKYLIPGRGVGWKPTQPNFQIKRLPSALSTTFYDQSFNQLLCRKWTMGCLRMIEIWTKKAFQLHKTINIHTWLLMGGISLYSEQISTTCIQGWF